MFLAFVRIAIAFVLACFVAGLVQVGFAIGPEALVTYQGDDRRTLEWVLLTATHSLVFAAPFALVAASISEWQSIRSILYHVAAGIGIAMAGFVAQYQGELPGQPSIANNYAMTTYFTTGALAGLTFWVFSGRFAGEPAQRLPQKAEPEPAAKAS